MLEYLKWMKTMFKAFYKGVGAGTVAGFKSSWWILPVTLVGFPFVLGTWAFLYDKISAGKED